MSTAIKKIGVAGCGQMGSGIAQVCAQVGYQVTVSEISADLLKKGLESIGASLSRAVAKGKLTEPERNAILSRVKGTTTFKDFSQCDLVIEAVVENLDAKKKVFAELDKICPPHTIIASNTSGFPIIEMAMATGRPDKVLGIHFFNPAPVMKLLEIVRSIATSAETLETAKAFGASIGKTVVVARDMPGFIVNRLMLPQVLNAIRMLESGVATREDIDTALTLGLNHPIGPLALADLIGLDTLYSLANTLYAEYKEPQYAPPVMLARMVSAGWLGRKKGKGFYDYPNQ